MGRGLADLPSRLADLGTGLPDLRRRLARAEHASCPQSSVATTGARSEAMPC